MKKSLFILSFYMLIALSVKAGELLGNNIRLFRYSPVWEIARAVKHQNVSRIKKFCAEHPKLVNCRESTYGFTLLRWAVYNRKFRAAEALLEARADPNIQDHDGASAFIEAAYDEKTSKYVKLLLENGGDVNAVSEKENAAGKTPLIAACRAQNLESIRLLLEHGANVNFRYGWDGSYYSPLYAVLLSERLEIIKFLIVDKNANCKLALTSTINGDSIYVTTKLREMTYPLDSREYKIKMEIVNYLKKQGIDYRKAPIPAMIQKRFANDKEYLEKY